MDDSAAYFKIRQVAKACSVSRATILRMEEDGLLVPAYTDEKNGYRYYSVDNMLQIRQILTLRSFGFSSDLIRQYIDHPADITPLIHELEHRMEFLKNTLADLHQRALSQHEALVLHTTLPMLTYYDKRAVMVGGFENSEHFLRDTFSEAIRKGLHLDLERNILLVTDRTDLLHGTYIEDAPFMYTACIPVLDKPDGNISIHPSTDILCCLWDGDMGLLTACFRKLNETIVEENLRVVGPIGFEVLLPDLPQDGDLYNFSEGKRLFRIGVPVMPL